MKPTKSPRLLRSQRDSVYNVSHAKRVPELPPLPASAPAAPSQLYQLVLKSSCYPPLMQPASWTLAAPFKEQSYHRSPSDSIANNYTPTARDLTLKKVHKVSSVTGTSLGAAERRTASPPSKECDPSRKKLKLSARSQRNSDSSLDPLSLPALAHMPGLRGLHYTDSQPLTPEEQFVVMHLCEKERSKAEKPPSGNDIERYCYYIHNGVQEDMLAPHDKELMSGILRHVPAHMLANPNLDKLLANLKEEVKADYAVSLMKAIVDYILMDPAERERLFTGSTPSPFPQRVVRAPVPWHSSHRAAKSWIEKNLFTVNPLMPTLQQLWLSQYSHLRFVHTGKLLQMDLPLLPAEFKEVIRRHCLETHNILQNESVLTVVTVAK